MGFLLIFRVKEFVRVGLKLMCRERETDFVKSVLSYKHFYVFTVEYL